MKLAVLLLPLFSYASGPANWEKCLDLADFSLPITAGFTSSGSIAKKGCGFRLVRLGEEGRKFEVNVCDDGITIQVFKSMDDNLGKRYRASSANCMFPMFGADFDADPSHIAPYEEAKRDILEMLNGLEKTYNIKNKREQLSSLPNSDKVLLDQVSCARTLLDEYIVNCASFEGKPEVKDLTPIKKNFDPPKENATTPIPGVHPAIIRK